MRLGATALAEFSNSPYARSSFVANGDAQYSVGSANRRERNPTLRDHTGPDAEGVEQTAARRWLTFGERVLLCRIRRVSSHHAGLCPCRESQSRAGPACPSGGRGAFTEERDVSLPLVDGVFGTSMFFVPTAPEARSSAFTAARLLAADGSLESEVWALAACAANSIAEMMSSLFMMDFLIKN